MIAGVCVHYASNAYSSSADGVSSSITVFVEISLFAAQHRGSALVKYFRNFLFVRLHLHAIFMLCKKIVGSCMQLHMS